MVNFVHSTGITILVCNIVLLIEIIQYTTGLIFVYLTIYIYIIHYITTNKSRRINVFLDEPNRIEFSTLIKVGEKTALLRTETKCPCRLFAAFSPARP